MKRVIVTPKGENVILLNNVDLNKEPLIVFDDLPFDRKEIGTIKSTSSELWYIEESKTKAPFEFKSKNLAFFDSIYILDVLLKELGYIICVE